MRITPEIENELHSRLSSGDPTASAAIAQLFLDPLRKALSRKRPGVEEALLKDAVTDAVLDYIQKPSTYNPEKARLFSYLMLAAIANLNTSLKRLYRVRAKEISLNPVEDDEDAQNYVAEMADPNAIENSRMVEILYGRRLAKELFEEIVDPVDRKVVALIVGGVRETAEYADAMGIANLPQVEQQSVVKKTKDRLTKQLQRFGVRTHGKPN